ncbi:Catechol 2,3-dioxygenase [Paenibacillus sp. UNCCL117]|uniref:VOC family protein n=1 Tax=unclassified Paenibacillus TaxID=185978 RepID=UPI00088CAF77|nr:MULTISPECIES: VOC family protein [unclassified Paenibacillus]SDD72423.1 Catechol 2,3-dioxygenase [Paenibacillus sp. cl123]SFW45724.1 Catechol 2,3-dioxygenase [Paenibacillus sp. UNCCL117]
MEKLVEHVDHVQLPVTDINKAVSWYSEVLGLEPLTVHLHAAWLKFVSGPVLMLHYSTKNEKTLWYSEDGFPMPSFMFLTKNIKLLHSSLQNYKVLIRLYEDHGFGWVIKFVDPYGNELGAYEPKEA